MLQYNIAYYLPTPPEEMVVAKVLDFPGALSQGFDLRDARFMIASALEDMAQTYLEEGLALPMPDPSLEDPEADLIEKVSLSVIVPGPVRRH